MVETHASTAKLRALTRRLVDLQETERRHISRELHDRVGQTLAALRINLHIIRDQLSGAGDGVIRQRTDDSIQLIESAFKAVQDLMYDLRPPMLDDDGLIAAMRWYASEYTRESAIEVEVHGYEFPRLAPPAELALFRIAQEALANAARRANATHVAVDISMDGGDAVLSISDDGRPGSAACGLCTMRERSEALGGTFAKEADEGKGTRIVVTIPRDAPTA